MLHDVREPRGDDVDGDGRDEGLAGRRVPLHTLRRFGRQLGRGGGVGGPKKLIRGGLFFVVMFLSGDVNFLVLVLASGL